MRHVNLRRNNTKRNKDSGVCWMQTIVLPLIKRWPSTLILWKIHAGSHLYNPVTGQIAPEYVNVADSLLIGERMAECYSASLPGGFYAPISCPIKTMSDAMKSNRNPDKPAIDLEYVCIRLMMIGQRRQLELLNLNFLITSSLQYRQRSLKNKDVCGRVTGLHSSSQTPWCHRVHASNRRHRHC